MIKLSNDKNFIIKNIYVTQVCCKLNLKSVLVQKGADTKIATSNSPRSFVSRDSRASPCGRKLDRITALPRQGWHRCKAFVSVFATGVCVIPRNETGAASAMPYARPTFRTHLARPIVWRSLRGGPPFKTSGINARTRPTARTIVGPDSD